METDKLMDADNFSLFELGVDVKGEFDGSGGPYGWTISTDNIADGLPRWLLDQPVLTLVDNGDVYIRGMYSPSLSHERRQQWVKFRTNKK